jgi:hypothetical protein
LNGVFRPGSWIDLTYFTGSVNVTRNVDTAALSPVRDCDAASAGTIVNANTSDTEA